MREGAYYFVAGFYECIGSNAGQWAFLLLSFHHLLPHHTPLRLFPRDAGLTHVRGTPVAKQSHPAMTHITKGGIQKKGWTKCDSI